MRPASAAGDLPTATAKRGDFAVIVRCRGALMAAHKVTLLAPEDVPDLQIVWLAPTGSQVKEGDPVIRFDGSKLQQDLREKTQALKQAQASLEQATAQGRIDADKGKLDLTQARADMEKARLEASKQAIVSVIQGEESAIDYHLAASKVTVQESATALSREANVAKIASQRRLRDQAQAELELAKRRLSQIEVKTPIAGLVSYLPNTSQGWMNAQNFKVGDHAYPGASIAEIPDLSSLQMESKVDEEDRGRIAVGNAVLVHVDAFPETALQARLVTISALTEQSFEEWPPARTFRAFAQIDHPDARMRPSMNAGADLVERKIANAISIPSRSVFAVGGQPTVYRKGSRGFEPVTVKIEARNPDEVAVSGIAAGTVVALAQPSEAKR
jgi:multidrug efflux pump subunit AcrA (membrane-fusion protein)